MIIFELLLTTIKASSILRGSWDIRKHLPEPKTESLIIIFNQINDTHSIYFTKLQLKMNYLTPLFLTINS